MRSISKHTPGLLLRFGNSVVIALQPGFAPHLDAWELPRPRFRTLLLCSASRLDLTNAGIAKLLECTKS